MNCGKTSTAVPKKRCWAGQLPGPLGHPGPTRAPCPLLGESMEVSKVRGRKGLRKRGTNLIYMQKPPRPLLTPKPRANQSIFYEDVSWLLWGGRGCRHGSLQREEGAGACVRPIPPEGAGLL